jgi:hypothetical protein
MQKRDLTSLKVKLLTGKRQQLSLSITLKLELEKGTAENWELKLNRNLAPFDALPDGEVQILAGLPDWASAKWNSDFITIYNNDSTAKVTQGKPMNIGKLRFRAETPTYTVNQTTNNGPESIKKNGKISVTSDFTVGLKVNDAGRYGFWETEINFTQMRNSFGSQGTASITSEFVTQGFILTHKAGDIYVLKYAPANDNAYLIKAQNDSHQNLGPVNMKLHQILVYSK